MKQNLIAYTVALLTLCTTPFGHAHADANANTAWVYDYDENAELLGYYIDAEVVPGGTSAFGQVRWHLIESRFDLNTQTLYMKDLHSDLVTPHSLEKTFNIKISDEVVPAGSTRADFLSNTVPHQYYPAGFNDLIYRINYQFDHNPLIKLFRNPEFKDSYCSKIAGTQICFSDLFIKVSTDIALTDFDAMSKAIDLLKGLVGISAQTEQGVETIGNSDIGTLVSSFQTGIGDTSKIKRIIRANYKAAFGLSLKPEIDVLQQGPIVQALVDLFKSNMIQSYPEAEGIYQSLRDSSNPHAAAALYDIETVPSKFAVLKERLAATVNAKYKPLLDKVADPVAFDAMRDVDGALTHNKVSAAQLARFFNKAARKATDAESKMMQAAGAAFDAVTAAWTVPFASAAKVVKQVPFKTAFDYCAANGKRLIRHCEELCYFLAFDNVPGFSSNYTREQLILEIGSLHSNPDSCLDQCDEKPETNSNVFTQGFTCFADKK